MMSLSSMSFVRDASSIAILLIFMDLQPICIRLIG